MFETSAVSSAQKIMISWSAMIVKNVAFWMFGYICHIMPRAIASSSSFWISGDVYFSSLFWSHSMISGFSWARRFSSWWKLAFFSDIVSVFQSRLNGKACRAKYGMLDRIESKIFLFLLFSNASRSDSKSPISLITVAGAVTYLATVSYANQTIRAFFFSIFSVRKSIFYTRWVWIRWCSHSALKCFQASMATSRVICNDRFFLFLLPNMFEIFQLVGLSDTFTRTWSRGLSCVFGVSLLVFDTSSESSTTNWNSYPLVEETRPSKWHQRRVVFSRPFDIS